MSLSRISVKATNNLKKYFETRIENVQQCTNIFVDAVQLVAEVGDLIEFLRDTFCHWAVHIGHGIVVHFVNNGDGSGIVVQETVEEVANGDKCRVNNLELAAAGHRLSRKTGRDIVSMAFQLLDQTRDYHVEEQNCEHFATECAYGTAFSQQAMNVKGNLFIRLFARYYCGNLSSS